MFSQSPTGEQELKEEEGLRLTAYFCPAGKLTIGWGHRIPQGAPRTITEEQAEAFYKEDVDRVLNELWMYFQPPYFKLTQNEIDALVSFIYNIGIGAWRGSTARRDLINAKYADVPVEMKRWIHDDKGNVIEGLKDRRDKEAAMFEGVTP